MEKINKKNLRYAILKDIDNEKLTLDSFKNYGVSKSYWTNQMNFLVREKYISKPVYGNDQIVFVKDVNLTEKGEDFLEDNSKLANGYKAAKEIRDWISAFI